VIPYTRVPAAWITTPQAKIASFLQGEGHNLDTATVKSFGQEWSRFRHFTDEELRIAGNQYFDIVSDSTLGPATLALDAGCGSGRWSRFIAGRVGFIEAVDASNAVSCAPEYLAQVGNIRVTQASIDDLPFPDESFDFIFSLGVLHHLPDTAGAIRSLTRKLKPGGRFLIYLYYNFENRGLGFRALFQLSKLVRLVVSALPGFPKHILCDLLAIFTYLPFIALASLVFRLFPRRKWYQAIPLSYYIDKSFKIIRNDALDRFGTPLEKRYRKSEIEEMMKSAGLTEIVFSNGEPYWHALGTKLPQPLSPMGSPPDHAGTADEDEPGPGESALDDVLPRLLGEEGAP
jgi:SAM-dependent methyltransferase